MKSMHYLAFILVVIGGLNWGLVALGNYMGKSWNVVDGLLGQGSTLGNLVYLLVGLSALVLLFKHRGDCRTCNP